MSRFFPQSQYAEDQPLATTILTTHVYFRGFQSGAGTGAIVGAVRGLIALRSSRASLASPSTTTTTPPPTLSTASRAIASSTTLTPRPMIASTIVRSTGTGALIGTGLMVVGLAGRMWGREDIEWRDRSWRLLQNPGQVEVDDWSVIGTAAGMAALAVSKSASDVGVPRRILGGAGIGSVAGTVGYMMWRYGIKGGER